jgi:acylphosphatase
LQNGSTFPFVCKQSELTTGKFSAGQSEFLEIVLRRRQFKIATNARFGLDCPVPERLPMTGRCRMEIFYSGHVQGVGFRYTAKNVAAGFEICGVVRNLADGRVHLIAEGSRGELESFRTAVHDAGLEHFIRDEQVTWTESQNEFRGFEIVR